MAPARGWPWRALCCAWHPLGVSGGLRRSPAGHTGGRWPWAQGRGEGGQEGGRQSHALRAGAGVGSACRWPAHTDDVFPEGGTAPAPGAQPLRQGEWGPSFPASRNVGSHRVPSHGGWWLVTVGVQCPGPLARSPIPWQGLPGLTFPWGLPLRPVGATSQATSSPCHPGSPGTPRPQGSGS